MLVDLGAIGLLIAVITVTFLGVLDRFLLGFGLTWTEELARFLLVWTSLLSAAAAARHGSHFKVDFLSRRFGKIGVQAIALLCLAISLAVCFYGVQLTLFFNAQTSPALGLPMSLVYASVPVSFALIAFYLLRGLLRPKPPEGDATGVPREGRP